MIVFINLLIDWFTRELWSRAKPGRSLEERLPASSKRPRHQAAESHRARQELCFSGTGSGLPWHLLPGRRWGLPAAGEGLRGGQRWAVWRPAAGCSRRGLGSHCTQTSEASTGAKQRWCSTAPVPRPMLSEIWSWWWSRWKRGRAGCSSDRSFGWPSSCWSTSGEVGRPISPPPCNFFLLETESSVNESSLIFLSSSPSKMFFFSGQEMKKMEDLWFKYLKKCFFYKSRWVFFFLMFCPNIWLNLWMKL